MIHRFKHLFKHPLFLIGFLFLLLLLSASLIHSVFFHGVIPNTNYLYDDGGLLTAKAPLTPLEVPPLGTGPSGNHMIFMLVKGAKATIGIAVIVAACRIFFSTIIGLCFANILSRFSQWITGFANGFYYIPNALICYFFLYDILMISGHSDDTPYTFFQRVAFELIVLTIIALPTRSLLIGSQVMQLYKEEFITAAKLLGSSRSHILRKHVFLHMWPKLLIQFAQEIVQVLVLLIHLGFFHLLLGGTLHLSSGTNSNPDKYISLSSEWSGMVGNAFSHLDSWPWYFFGPMVAFALVILGFNFMVKGMEDVFFGFRFLSAKSRKQRQQNDRKPSPQDMRFEFIQRENL